MSRCCALPFGVLLVVATCIPMAMADDAGLNHALRRDGLGAWLNPSDETRFRQLKSEHFAVLYDTDEAAAAQRLELLDRTRQRFFDCFARAGFVLREDHGRLVCILFNQRDDFDQYAFDFDRVDMSWSRGYYSARTNRVALLRWHDPVPGQQVAQGEASSSSSPARAEAVSYPTDGPARTTILVDTSLASVTHEAAHQLAFSGGLQQRGVMYPLWATEGLAANFEVAASDEPFGPEYDNAVRREHLQRFFRLDRLLPLDEFVVTTRVPAGSPEVINQIYSQAWGFFKFLFLHRTAQLRHYLERVASLEPGARDVHTLHCEFVASFGPIPELERDWRRYLETLP